MDLFHILLVIFINILFISQSKVLSKDLKLVLIVHRHGDRAPVFTFPTDRYKDEEKYWPDSYEMLTTNGKQRMYSLGKYIRKRYKNFLGYSPREVFIRSSGRDRCLESVSLLLAGLYPPVGRWKWNNDLGQVWQPFSIQTVKFSLDGMLNPDSICPKAEADLALISKSKIVKNFMKKHEKLVKFIENKSGAQINHFNVGRDMFNTLEIQKSHKYSLPDWVNETVYHCLEEFHEMTFIFYSSTQLQKRLRTGLLLKDMSQRMNQLVTESKPKHKVVLYSTHDTVVAALLNSLNVYNHRSPPYGAAVLFELYKLQTHYKLELHYLNVTESEKTFELSLKECLNANNECLLDKFLDSIKNLIPIDWELECKKSNSISSLIKLEF